MGKDGAVSPDGHPWRHWTLGWLSGAGIGVANGAVRRMALGRRMSEQRAHQLSTLMLLLAIGQRFRHLQRRYPVRRTSTALAIGATWAALTVGFELAMGRLVTKKSWDELISDYDLRQGRVWSLVPVCMLVGPEVVRRAFPAETETDG